MTLLLGIDTCGKYKLLLLDGNNNNNLLRHGSFAFSLYSRPSPYALLKAVCTSIFNHWRW